MNIAFTDPDTGKLSTTRLAEYIAPDLARGLDGDMYVYADGIYLRDERIITKRVAAALGDRYSSTVEKQVEAHLLNVSLIGVGVRALPGGYLNHIVLENGVYQWPTDELEGHNPLLGALTRLPIRYSRDARAPRFSQWLTDVLGSEGALIDHVWEILGYLLLTGNPLQKMILFYGEGGNGKGTLLRVIGALLGEDNFSAISLHTLVEDRFAASGLYGKIANISGDLSSRFVNEPEILKQITGGDAITTSRKYGHQFTFVPYAVPVFASNDFFRTSDTSYGWRRRWEVVEFARKVDELGDFDERDLLEELPGIFNEAMIALRRLMQRQRFDPPAVAREATTRLHDAADPLMLWLDEDDNVVRGAGLSAPRSDVYARYKKWTHTNGYQPLASGPFGTRLKQLGITSSRRMEAGDRHRYYDGISVFLSGDD
ncbi:DNA primase family protein [Microbacterium keratanolyticum]